MTHSNSPPSPMLRAFNLSGRAQPLAGGQNESFVLDGVVLKPTREEAETEWMAELQYQLVQKGNPMYRIAEPIAVPGSNPRTYVVHGWTATRFIAGWSDDNIRPAELLTAVRAMHADLRPLADSMPAVVRNKTTRWGWADRIAWDEVTLSETPDVEPSILRRIQPYLDRLYALHSPFTASEIENQVIHGDLAGNVLYGSPPNNKTTTITPAMSSSSSTVLAPAILDFAPYWRPVAYAEATVAVDGLLWRGEGVDLVRSMLDDPSAPVTRFQGQMLVRALICRTVTYAIQRDGVFAEKDLPRMNFDNAVGIVEELWREATAVGKRE